MTEINYQRGRIIENENNIIKSMFWSNLFPNKLCIVSETEKPTQNVKISLNWLLAIKHYFFLWLDNFCGQGPSQC